MCSGRISSSQGDIVLEFGVFPMGWAFGEDRGCVFQWIVRSDSIGTSIVDL